jgi:hypothetical protein
LAQRTKLHKNPTSDGLDVKGLKPFANFSTDATMVSTLPFATSFISCFHFCTKDAATYITLMGLSGNFFWMQNLFLVIHKAQASPATRDDNSGMGIC